MKSVVERFLSYIQYDTASDRWSETFPSSEKQKIFAQYLVEELKSVGVQDARMDEYGYVYGSIHANCSQSLPVIGLISHLDTVSEPDSFNIKPRIIHNYDGGDVLLNAEQGVVLSPEDYPNLRHYKGHDLIVTDGTTILGGDDKAGIASIISGVEQALSSGKPHGPFRFAFTPDEEIGRGTRYFDIKGFGADFAFTLDGGKFGDYQYENFNAAQIKIVVRGRLCHLRRGKSRGLVNAIKIAIEFQSMLPAFQDPANTERYEGFFHLDRFDGQVARAELLYRINDHDRKKFQKKKDLMNESATFLNRKYGAGTVEVSCEDLCYNMYDQIKDKLYILDRAKRAMRAAGAEPNSRPVRGFTDGAKLSYMGLPCPNLCMGSENAHSIYEFSSVQSLEGVCRMVYHLITDISPMVISSNGSTGCSLNARE